MRLGFVLATVLATTLVATGFAIPRAPTAAPPMPGITGGIGAHVVEKGESLRRVSARFGVDAATLAADNGLAADARLDLGQTLRIDNRHIVPLVPDPGAFVVNVPQRMLYFGDGGAVIALPVAVGRSDWETPTVPFTVLAKATDPTWTVPASILDEARRAGRPQARTVPPGPANPLGRFWIGLSIPSVGIHSTNAPSSIYRAATHGCIRVGPSDMAWLFPRVAIGARGQILYEPILLTESGGGVLLEVHPDVYRRRTADPLDVVRTLARAAGLDDDIDWAVAARVVAARAGVARPIGVEAQTAVR